MRGFFSFFLVVVALSALFAGSEIYLKNLQTARASESELLLVERAHAAEMDAKHAILDGIREEARALSVSPMSSGEMAAAIFLRLSALEPEVSGREFHGFNASLWCGTEGVPLGACAPSLLVDANERLVFLRADLVIVLRDENANFTSFIQKGTVVSY